MWGAPARQPLPAWGVSQLKSVRALDLRDEVGRGWSRERFVSVSASTLAPSQVRCCWAVRAADWKNLLLRASQKSE